MVLAASLAVVVIGFVVSPTLGNDRYYNHFSNTKGVTQALESSLMDNIASASEDIGVDVDAYSQAVGTSYIDAVKSEMILSVFSGFDYDYSESAGVRRAYSDGIREYCSDHGEKISAKKLDQAVGLGCSAFNSALAVNDGGRVSMIPMMSRYPLMLGVVALVMVGWCIYRLLYLNHGRTRVLAHYGAAAMLAGLALCVGCCGYHALGLKRFLAISSNQGFNILFAKATGVSVIIIGALGAGLAVAGVIMYSRYRAYYARSRARHMQEQEINSSLLVAGYDQEPADSSEDK